LAANLVGNNTCPSGYAMHTMHLVSEKDHSRVRERARECEEWNRRYESTNLTALARSESINHLVDVGFYKSCPNLVTDKARVEAI